MSIARHHLRVTSPDGATAVQQTLAAWGFEGCRVRRQSGGEDEMQLSHAALLTAEALIEGGSTVELFDANGVRRFYGYALRPRRSVSGAAQRHVVRVVGPHWWLSRVTYVEPWTFVTDTEDPESPTETSDISNVVLNRITGVARVKLSVSIAEILSTAAGLDCPVDWDFENFPEVYLPEIRERIATPWQLLRDLLQFVPQVTAAWDYTGEAGTDPILRFSSVRAGEILCAAPQKELWLSRVQNEGVQVIPRDDLLVNTVRVHYIAQYVLEQEGQRPVTLRGVTTKTSAAVEGEDGFTAFGSVDITFSLRGATWHNGDMTQEPELVPPDGTGAFGPRNLAESLHEAFIRLWHEVSGTVVLQSTDWTWTVGQRVLPIGWGAELDTARMLNVSVENDVAAGTVALQCGPPGRLVHGSVYDMVRAARASYPGKEDKESAEEPDNSQHEHADAREELYHTHGGVLFKGDFDVTNDAEA